MSSGARLITNQYKALFQYLFLLFLYILLRVSLCCLFPARPCHNVHVLVLECMRANTGGVPLACVFARPFQNLEMATIRSAHAYSHVPRAAVCAQPLQNV